MRLAVELYGSIIGTIEGDSRAFDFAPDHRAIERFGAASPLLSVAILMVAAQRRDHAGRRRNRFAELLPAPPAHGLRRGDRGLRRTAGDRHRTLRPHAEITS